LFRRLKTRVSIHKFGAKPVFFKLATAQPHPPKALVQPTLRIAHELPGLFYYGDALSAADGLSAKLGLNISRSGLLRLAGFLQPKTAPVMAYSYDVDPGLRKLLGFGPPLELSGAAFKSESLTLPRMKDEFPKDGACFTWTAFHPSVALAAASIEPTAPAEVTEWLLPEGDIQPYLGKVRQVLDEASEKIVAANSLDSKYQLFYRVLVLATAWQETCWRQFLKKKGSVRPILSYDQSSIGLMQINVRVWRELYRPEDLHWNIRYNALAGTEIIYQYLRRYALKKMAPKNPLDMDTLAQMVYAMYNGGPREFYRLPKRK
jgi:hypothetical protein